MVLLSTLGAYACLQLDSLDGKLANLDLTRTDSIDCEQGQDVIPLEVKRPQGGHPLIVEKDVTSDSGSTMDTNPDNEFVTDLLPWKKYSSSKCSPQLCPVCHVGVRTKGDLCFHLKSFHWVSKPYLCSQYDSAFNNTSDLVSHVWSTHSQKKVHCKHCTYHSTSDA